MRPKNNLSDFKMIALPVDFTSFFLHIDITDSFRLRHLHWLMKLLLCRSCFELANLIVFHKVTGNGSGDGLCCRYVNKIPIFIKLVNPTSHKANNR